MKILAISGSLRKKSYNRMLLRLAADFAPSGHQVIEEDISDLPLYNQDLENEMPETVANFKRKVKEADAILFVTPEYNYSVPGVLKNAIDWGSRPYGDNSWEGKPVGIMGASTSGFGTVRAQFHLRQVLVYLNMFALNKPEVYVSHAEKTFDENGKLLDDSLKAKISVFLNSLASWANKLQHSK